MFGIIVFISNISDTFGATDDTAVKTSLSGRVTDKKTGEPIPGVAIYIPDLQTGASSDDKGNYKIENLPRTKVLVQVTSIGYNLIAQHIDLATTTTKDFELTESVAELNEVVVTGLSGPAEKDRTPTPITAVRHIELIRNSSTNIIDALAEEPGVSQITTGAGISKPVIRGLGYNRVVTVHDGIRQEGQQWGDEHGIEIDEYSVNRVEILKGPASLAYGSDAMAGVINMISDPTLPDGKIMGNILANYQTNNGLLGYSADFAGNRKGFIWNARYSNKMAHAYKNRYDGYVFNSGYNENTLSGMIGLNKSWGYSHLIASAYSLTPGIVEGERDSLTGKFLKPVDLNGSEGAVLATDKDFKSYTPVTPYQKVHHYKAVLNNNFVIDGGNLKTIFGFQQNQRQEYADILRKDQYGLYFLLNTYNYDVRYLLPEMNKYNISFGVNGMRQISQNKGIEFLIPDYNLFDIGGFAIVKKNIDKLDISGGLRYDTRFENGKDLYLNNNGEKVDSHTAGAIRQFKSFNSTYSGISGSIGAAYQISGKVFTKFNVSRGFRAPNIAEISANGVHEGTVNYIIGNPELKPENSLQFDYAFGLNTKYLTGEVDLFSNKIYNYIYQRKLNSVFGGDSIRDGFSTFNYVSGDALLMGGEISVDLHPHPLDWLHFKNTFSYVSATQKGQPDSTRYLPFTPAPKFTSELRATKRKWGKSLANSYVRFEVISYFTQNKFYAAFGTETATPGATLLNFGAGTDVTSNGKTRLSIYINVNNITDVAYQSHLSRLKYEDVNNVTGRMGVFNMGRNISFKLIVPVDFSDSKAD